MTYHANARTNLQQRKRIRQSRDPYRVQAEQMGVSVATVANSTLRRNSCRRSTRSNATSTTIALTRRWAARPRTNSRRNGMPKPPSGSSGNLPCC